MKRPGKAEPDEVVGTGHALVVELRIQAARETSGSIGATARGESGIDEVSPIAVDNGKIAQDFSGREREGSAQFVGVELQPEILSFAAADRAFGILRHRVKTRAFLIFMDGAAKKIGQGICHLCFSEIRDGFSFMHRGRFVKSARCRAVFNMRLRGGERRERAFEDIPAVMGKMQPAIGGRRGTAGGLQRLRSSVQSAYV